MYLCDVLLAVTKHLQAHELVFPFTPAEFRKKWWIASLCEALTREEFKCLEMEDNKTNQLYRRRYVHAFSHIISIVIALLLVAFILGSTSPARTKRLLRRVASHPGRNWLFGGRGRRRRLRGLSPAVLDFGVIVGRLLACRLLHQRKCEFV